MTLAIVGATVGGRVQADDERTIGDQEKGEKEKALLIISICQLEVKEGVMSYTDIGYSSAN